MTEEIPRVDIACPAEAFDYERDGFVVAHGRAMRRVDVTPELAAEMLATLGPEARCDYGKVARYAALMRAGEWRLMALPIIYRGGRLTSSRDRLAAVIESGLPSVPMYVVDDTCPR